MRRTPFLIAPLPPVLPPPRLCSCCRLHMQCSNTHHISFNALLKHPTASQPRFFDDATARDATPLGAGYRCNATSLT